MTQNPESGKERGNQKNSVLGARKLKDAYFGLLMLGSHVETKRMTIREKELVRDLLVLIGVTENEESACFGHGDSLLLQLDVRQWAWPRTYRHLWLFLIIIS